MADDDAASERPNPVAPDQERGWSPNDAAAGQGSILGDEPTTQMSALDPARTQAPAPQPGSTPKAAPPPQPGSTPTPVPPPNRVPPPTPARRTPTSGPLGPRQHISGPLYGPSGATDPAAVTGPAVLGTAFDDPAADIGYEMGVGDDPIARFDSQNTRELARRRARHSRRRAPNWSMIAKAGLIFVVIVGGIAIFSRLRSDDSVETAAFGGPGGPIANPTVDEMAQATVQIVGLDAASEPLCSGSGTFVSSDGLILTNAHVVTRDLVCDFATLGIAVTNDTGLPPQILYRADLVTLDAEADLAVLKVTRSLDPSVPLPVSFPALMLGDSDQLEIGDDLRILGYPEIGGETITFTNGSVSGFTAQEGLGDRALIKTDATIAGGNSGGAAVDADGSLIGIPTKARATESGPAVDCRAIDDTNGDGIVDNADNCVPIGGFLNGIRPINLADPLIERARSTSPGASGGPIVEVDVAAVTMSRPRFSIGEFENAPTQLVITSTSGVPEICLFVDWDGIPNGAEWDAVWYHDGEAIDEYSLRRQTWEFGEEGSNFWMCAIDDESGLATGLYELGFFLGGEVVFAEGIVLTDEPAEIYDTIWENQADIDVCGLAINPEGSGQVGLSELRPGEFIAPGETTTVRIPAGRAVVEASDCDNEPLADSAGSIEIAPDRIYTINIAEQPTQEPGG